MPPPIILDSDDEETDYFSSNSPRAVPLQPPAPMAVRSPARVSHETTSTDSSFFQNIFDEQNNAAYEKAPRPRTRSPEKKRNAEKQGYAQELGGWIQQSTPGRRKAPTAVMDDPWDVPSSPELFQPQLTSNSAFKRNESRLATHRDPEQRSPRDIRHQMRERNRSSEDAINSHESPIKQRKRRKVEQPQNSLTIDNDIDLVTIPPSHETEPAPTPSMLPPTLPINGDVSFYITSKPLTDAQKMEYQSIHLTSSDGTNGVGNHNPTLPVLQNDFRAVASSGSATNLNTQRSDGLGFSTAPLPSDATDSGRHMNGLSAPQPWGSSPDIIAADEWPPKPKETRQRAKQTYDTPEKPTAAKEVVEIIDVPEDVELPVPDKPETGVVASKSVEQPGKQKKTRGRPKKGSSTDIAQHFEQVEPIIDEPVPKQQQKKKRGRPKKSEQATTSSDETKVVHEKAISNGETRPSSSKAPSPVEDSGLEDNKPESSNNERGVKNEVASTETKFEATTGPDTKAQMSEEKHIDTHKIEDEKENTPIVAIKSATPSRGLSALLNKPVYRVGLSKRSRIAPLLKSLRKD